MSSLSPCPPGSAGGTRSKRPSPSLSSALDELAYTLALLDLGLFRSEDEPVLRPGSVAELISTAEDALAEAGAEVIELERGRVIRQAAFPHVYDTNLVRRVRLRPADLDPTLAELQAPLRQIGARHLQLVLDGSDVPESVAPLLDQRGFARDRLLAMVLDGPLERRTEAGVHVRRVPDEVPWATFERIMDRMNREESWYAPSVSREIIGSMRLKSELGALTLFIAEQAGQVAGTVGLALHRGVASIVSLGTRPDLRRRGIGRTLVIDAVERAHAAAARLVYLVARANDSPQEMYRKLGFRIEFGFDVWLHRGALFPA